MVFRPSRWYAVFAVLALVSAVACSWFATLLGDPQIFSPATIAWAAVSGLFGATTIFSVVMMLRPRIRVSERGIQVGRKKQVAWEDVVSLETSRWTSPLIARLRLADESRVTILYPGDGLSCHHLLHLIGLNVRNATLDGIPYDEVWGGIPVDQEGKWDFSALSSTMEPRELEDGSPEMDDSEIESLLLAEDVEEVERLYQRLKKVGHLDQPSGDEKN